SPNFLGKPGGKLARTHRAGYCFTERWRMSLLTFASRAASSSRASERAWMRSASAPLGVWINSSQALSRASNSRFIRENLLENGVGLGVGYRFVEAFPRLLKLEQFASDFRGEMAGRILGVFDHALEL